MLAVLLATVMILACLLLIQVIKKPEIHKGLLTLDHTDIIKGASIFVIVVGHIAYHSGLTFVNPIGLASLAAFLICSGFGLQKSYEKNGLKDFFRKRLLRIIIPYWIAVVAFFLLNPSKFSLLSLLEALLLIETYSYWWFVQFIVVSYILFYFVYSFVPEKFRLPCIFLLSTLFFAVMRFDLQASQAFSLPVGILISKYCSKTVVSQKKAVYISLGSLLLGVAFLAAKFLPAIHSSIYPVYNAFQVLISLLFAIPIIGMTYALMKLFIIRMLAAAGRASYELYITHTLLIFMILNQVTVPRVALYIVLFGASSVAFYYLNKLITKRLSKSPAEVRKVKP
jgi:peptidoglycan/LPS O-acetylase OafA/YrhL